MKIGDTVRFLNSVGGGKVVKIDGQLAYVEDEDGFQVPVLMRECVVVAQAADAQMTATVDKASSPMGHKAKTVVDATPTPRAVADRVPGFKPSIPELSAEAEETEGGNTLNVVLAFAASDLKRLSDPSVSYDAFLVNDSNYFLAYSLAARSDEAAEWSPLAQGIIEPNIQEFIAEISREMLPNMDRIVMQYIAFKPSKSFGLKAPGSIDIKLDTTKFFKLHCFRPSDYFDEPVIELKMITADMPLGQAPAPNPELLRRNMMEKQRADRRSPRPVSHRSKPSLKPGEPIVTDLHITELVDSTRGLSNADMLNLQVDRFREVMDANLKEHGRKLIFIHGKGEGVLRAAILKELSHRYKGHDVQDASFLEYGYGATQVTIR
ncbi:MAG: DUF2027 domain-containing protein [Pseudoflavonifractor sp.]|nr:DUF2027 domain-containing protein [Alloprevotella sp.]MCM1116653.1 DUF2027 domain-containing protein [Pseudoflavonifractor sp.]